MTNPSQRRLAAASILALATTLESRATGFRLPDQDAFATARGEAFAATADNPSAIYYNPAGITQLEGHQVRGGVYGLNLNVSYESLDRTVELDNRKDLHAIPQLFYTYTPKEFPLAFGLGMYSPFGLSSEWPDNSTLRSVGTRGKLMYWTFNPVVAWRIHPNFSIAGGPTLNFADFDLRQGVLPFAGGNDVFRFEGDGFEPGFNVGALWKIHPKVQLGLTYRSETRFDLDGSTDLRSPLPSPGLDVTRPASAVFPFPQSCVAGISYRPTEAWNLEFNVEWTDWSRLQTVMIRQQPVTGLPDNQPLVLNWDSSFYYEFGLTRYLANGWSVSGGYIFNENSIPDATYNPLVADLDRHFLSIGTGYKGDGWSFDLAYQFGYGPTRTVTGSAINPNTGQSADGRYEFLSHALFLTLGWHF